MNILIVDELAYPQLGGQQVRFKELAEEWVKMGSEVTIVAIDHIGNLPGEEIINGVKYKRILHDATYYKSGVFGRNVRSIVKFSFLLRPYFKKQWDLIIFNQFPMLPSLFYKWFYRKRSKTILDFVEHRDTKMWRVINKSIINSTDITVCISNHVKACAEKYKQGNIFVIPSLVDTGVAYSKAKETYVFLGRLEEHKHPDHAISAVLKYNELYSQKKSIHVMGDGSLYSDLKKKYSENDLVIFHGRVSDEQKDEILANARILILPSEREGLPKVVIEAMSYGIPTLTTDYPGNGTQYFVKEEGIGAVADPTVDDLAVKISLIEQEYADFSGRCYSNKEKYDLKVNSVKYLKLVK